MNHVNVFVAGGTGALGRRVVRMLVEAGHSVQATARTPQGAQMSRAAGAEPINIDLFDAVAVSHVLTGTQAALRLTTRIPPVMRMRSAKAWRETGRLRNQGAEAMVDACFSAGVSTYVHESVTFVYADGGEAWLDEDAALDVGPTPLRDAASGEASATRFTTGGGRGVVLRFAGFYAADASQTLAMAQLARRRRLALVGPSVNYFSSVHLDDAASAVVAALGAPAGVYNVADNDPVPLGDYMGCLARAAGAPPLRRLPSLVGPLALGEVWRYLRRSQRVSAARFRSATGWEPQVSDARVGLARISSEWAQASVTVSQGSTA
jgi:nucleoside-diphosphate-sugar epimerase